MWLLSFGYIFCAHDLLTIRSVSHSPSRLVQILKTFMFVVACSFLRSVHFFTELRLPFSREIAMPGGVFSGIELFAPKPLAIEFLFCYGTTSSMMLAELLTPDTLRFS